MNAVEVKIKKIHEDAKTPTYGTAYAAGADLYAVEETVIEPGKTKLIKTGIQIDIPEGTFAMITPRSGMSLKTDLRVANAPGVADSDYRGEICVIGSNYGDEYVIVNKGERIAQMLIMPYITAHFVDADKLSDTVRGEGGFGSTGTK